MSISYTKTNWQDLPVKTTPLSAANLNKIENGIADSVDGVNSNSQSIAELQTRISQVASGTPTPVATVAEMTDESAVYLYTGSETGYTAGNWYFWNGTAWTSGGTYGGVATDSTLSLAGVPADAKAVGDALAEKADADDVNELNERLDTNVNNVESLKSVLEIGAVEWAHTDKYYIATGSTINVSNPYSYSATHHGKCVFMPCSAGDVFIVTIKGGSNYLPYVFCASDGTIIEVADTWTLNNVRLVAPENTAYVGFNTNNSDTYKYVQKGDYENAIVRLEQVSQDATDRVDAIAEELGEKTTVTWVNTAKKYVKTDGTSIDPSAPYSSSTSWLGKSVFMECSAGDVFVVSLKGGSKFRPYVFCSSDGTIIARADNIQYHNERVVAPQNTAYVGFNSDPADAYGTVIAGETAIENINYRIDTIAGELTAYSGLDCVAFGTSLTYRDLGYRPYLAEILGMTIDNQGVGSAYWCTWHETSSNVLYNVTNYQNYADKDVCIIEGCTNDWHANADIGTYKDTGTDTVCGCLYNMISHVYAQNPEIQIFVILDHFGQVSGSSDRSATALNSGNHTQYDYYVECAKLCEFYGIPCIKEFAESSIGIFGTQYLDDYIHLNVLGGKQSAQFIAENMIRVKPKKRA